MIYPFDKIRRINVKPYTQWIATFGVFILMMQIGILTAWPSPNLPRLLDKNSNLSLTQQEVSWVVAFVSLGAIAGSIVGSIANEYLGSERTILSAFIVLSITWGCLFAANSATWFYAFRFLDGIATAMAYCSYSFYISEVSVAAFRGTYIQLATGGTSIGLVIGTIAESYLPRKMTSTTYLVVCLIAIILFICLPDSPYHLVKLKDFKAARRSISIYYNGCEVEEEFNEIKKFVEDEASLTITDKLYKIKTPTVRKSMMIVLILFILPHLTGYSTIMAYMETILSNAQVNLIDRKQLVIYANISFVIAIFLSVKLLDKLGRRVMLIISSVGVAIATGSLGLFFFFLHSGYGTQSLQIIPVLAILLYTTTFALGYASVPVVVLSELFPQNIKSIAACLLALCTAFTGFFVTKSYEPITASIGEECILWVFAGFALFTTLFAVFILPETKGKTFSEIQEHIRIK